MRFAALGRTRWLLDSIARLAQAGHEPVLIGTAPPAPEYGVGEADFERVAREHGCAYFADPAINTQRYADLALASGAQVAVSMNWPILLGARIRSCFEHGVVNAHAGDLPRYRGNACPNWAILNGEDRVVVTLHRMDDGLDDGPILLQDKISLTTGTYISDVYRELGDLVPRLFTELLDLLSHGTLVPKVQDTSPPAALRCYPRHPQDGRIDWRQPAGELAALVRASAEPFAGAYTYLDGRLLRIWRARQTDLPFPWLGVPGQVAQRFSATGDVAVLCGQGVLTIEEVQMEGVDERVAAVRAIRSARARLGEGLEERLRGVEQRLTALEALHRRAGR